MSGRPHALLSRGLMLAPVVSLLVTSAALAAESSTLAQGRDVVAMPGIGRVIFAFVLTTALAIGIAVVLKRVLPKLNGPLSTSGSVRVIERASLGAGLKVHVVQIDDSKVLVAESRHGVSITVLKNKSGDETPQRT